MENGSPVNALKEMNEIYQQSLLHKKTNIAV
jgi:hypothetical protein